MNRNNLFILLIITLCFVACKPYDSNKVNKEMLQGKWILVNANYPVEDSIKIDYSKEITYLIFNGDSCIEHMPDLQSKTNYRFNIDDYVLKLYQDSTLIGKLEVIKLSADSLVLSGQNQLCREYKKTE